MDVIYLTGADDGDVTRLGSWIYLHTQLGHSLVDGAIVTAEQLVCANDDSHSNCQALSGTGCARHAETSMANAIATMHQPGWRPTREMIRQVAMNPYVWAGRKIAPHIRISRVAIARTAMATFAAARMTQQTKKVAKSFMASLQYEKDRAVAALPWCNV